MAKQDERQVKLRVGDWLKQHGCSVYDETVNPERLSQWDGTFKVRGIGRKRKPDLVIRCNMLCKSTGETQKDSYVALEIKTGYKHQSLVEGFWRIQEYFDEYCRDEYCGEVQYSIIKRSGQRSHIEIAVFALATAFSREGYLYKEEGCSGLKWRRFEGRRWKYRPITFTCSRLLWTRRTSLVKLYRASRIAPSGGKGVKKQFPELGVLVKNPSPKIKRPVLLTSEANHYWQIYE